VRQDFGELGRRALDRLLYRIAGTQQEKPGPWVPVAPELVVRSSAARPRLLS
jgi:DNA-binding LacI/PurR family transcriptional regulator